MTDLAVIEARYSKALDAKPGKGEITAAGISAITDSVCDIPELVERVKVAKAAVARVRELHRAHRCTDDPLFECLIIHGGECARVGRCAECDARSHPCPTLRALDGEP